MYSEMGSIMIDDSRVSSAISSGNFLNPDSEGILTRFSKITKYKIARYDAYTWAQNLHFLTYDDSDDVMSDETSDWIDMESDENSELRMRDSSSWKGKGIEVPHVKDRKNRLEEFSGISKSQEEYSKSSISERVEPVDVDDEDDEQQTLDYAIALSLAEEDDQNFLDFKAPDNAVSNDEEDSSGYLEDLPCDYCESLPLFPSNKKPRTFRVIRGKPNNVGLDECLHYIAVSYCWPKDKDGNPVNRSTTYRVRMTSDSGEVSERKNRAPDYVIDRAVEFAISQDIRLIWIDQECLPQDNSREQELGVQGMDMVYQRALATVALFDSVVEEQAQLDAVAAVLHWGTQDRTLPAHLSPDITRKSLLDFLEIIADDQWNTRAWILQESFAAGHEMACLLKTKSSIVYSEPAEDEVLPYADLIPGSFCIMMRDIQRLIDVSWDFLLSTASDLGTEDVSMGPEERRASRILERMKSLHPVPPTYRSWTHGIHMTQGTNYGSRKTCSAATALTSLRTRFNFRVADRLVIMANICDYEFRLDTMELESRFKSLSECLFALALMNGDLTLLNPEFYQSLKIKDYPSWMPQIALPLFTIESLQLRPGQNISLRNPNFYQFSARGFSCPAYQWDVNRLIDLTPLRLKWRRLYAALKVYDVRKLPEETLEEAHARRAMVESKLTERLEQLNDPKYDENLNEWSPANDPTVTGIVDASNLRLNQGEQDLIGEILIDILRYLYDNNEIALANSIWQSLRHDALPRGENGDSDSKELPDDVGDLLLDEELISDPWIMFHLDRDRYDSFYPVWLLDRVVEQGFLWVGEYLPPTSSPYKAVGNDDDDNTLLKASEFSDDTNMVVAGSSKESSTIQDEDSQPAKKQSILDRQMTKQIIAMAVKAQFSEEKYGKVGMFNIGSLVGFTSAHNDRTWGEKAEADRYRKVAVFNVDGPCLVSTPYDSDRERLPHPEERSMDICWVIERVGDGFSVSAAWSGEEERGSTSTEPGQYRVLANVKGMWEIMDDPTQKYNFI